MFKKTTVISVSGKGGTGKTTLVALLLKILKDRGFHNSKSILAVDADPDTNLPDVLGISVDKTVGKVANQLKKRIESGSFSTSISKRDILEAWVYDTLIEEDYFDMLVMGRTEGEGCYCYVNSILTNILDVLMSNYDIIIMDMEAGLEHISRRTDRDVDIMIVVSDASKMGLKTAERIKELIKEIHVKVDKIYLVGNRFPEEMVEMLRTWSSKTGIPILGVIPEDPLIFKYNMLGRSLLNLPKDTPSVLAAEDIAKNLGIID